MKAGAKMTGQTLTRNDLSVLTVFESLLGVYNIAARAFKVQGESVWGNSLV